MSVERVILVDENDREIGTAEKLRAHHEGQLHRAFSVFLMNGGGEILLQRRAHDKYHSAGLWSNTCCSHPRPGEAVQDAAERRLREEMGITAALESIGAFTYRVRFDSGLREHEYDHVFVGAWSGEPAPDPAEVSGWRWVGVAQLRRELQERPGEFTAWLAPALEVLEKGGAFDSRPTADYHTAGS